MQRQTPNSSWLRYFGLPLLIIFVYIAAMGRARFAELRDLKLAIQGLETPIDELKSQAIAIELKLKDQRAQAQQLEAELEEMNPTALDEASPRLVATTTSVDPITKYSDLAQALQESALDVTSSRWNVDRDTPENRLAPSSRASQIELTMVGSFTSMLKVLQRVRSEMPRIEVTRLEMRYDLDIAESHWSMVANLWEEGA